MDTRKPVSTRQPQMERYCTDSQGFRWQQGASYVAKRLLTGEHSLVTAEHGLHCLEIMIACRESSRTGTYIDIHTAFDWPVIKRCITGTVINAPGTRPMG